MKMKATHNIVWDRKLENFRLCEENEVPEIKEHQCLGWYVDHVPNGTIYPIGDGRYYPAVNDVYAIFTRKCGNGAMLFIPTQFVEFDIWNKAKKR